MIALYSGTPGSGKSYHAAYDVYNRLRFGHRVISNSTYNLSYIPDKHRDKLVYVDNSELTPAYLMEYSKKYHKPGRESQTLIVIDECAVKFNCRDIDRKDRSDWISLFAQHRKLGFDVVLITQNDRMIDRQIRSLIEYDVKHRNAKNFKIWGFLFSILFGGGSVFVAIKVWYGMRERIGAQFFPYRRKIGKFYNTFEMYDENRKAAPAASSSEAPRTGVPAVSAGGAPVPGDSGKPKRRARRNVKEVVKDVA